MKRTAALVVLVATLASAGTAIAADPAHAARVAAEKKAVANAARTGGHEERRGNERGGDHNRGNDRRDDTHRNPGNDNRGHDRGPPAHDRPDRGRDNDRRDWNDNRRDNDRRDHDRRDNDRRDWDRRDNDRRDNDRRDWDRNHNDHRAPDRNHDGRPDRWDHYRGDWNRHPNYWDNRRHDRADYARYRYHSGSYYRPAGYYSHVWRRGDRLPRAWYGNSYVVYDWRPYRLYSPPYGYHWVRVGDDVLLTALATGVVLDVIYNIWY